MFLFSFFIHLHSYTNMADKSLAGKVCIVTGATRGIGKGIALQLGEKGAKVYITGRTLEPPTGSKVGGSLRDTSEKIRTRSGECISVQCDHSKDDEIENLFQQVKQENEGQLDILVNNAYAAVDAIFSYMGVKFWDTPVSVWDTTNNVGLRNHYICSVYAARMMVPRKRGLIVNISGGGGLRYEFNVAFGVGKEACDRMAADCGHELFSSNVAFVSLWPSAVGTEEVLSRSRNMKSDPSTTVKRDVPLYMSDPKIMAKVFENAETPEFVGQCVAGLATDPDIMKKSGKIILTYDLGQEYGLQDKEGHTPIDSCSVKNALSGTGHTWLAALTPAFVRIPKWIMALGGNKFY